MVLGAPGTGKSVLAQEVVVAAVDAGLRAEDVLVLSATRRGAGELRDALAGRLSAATRGAVVRTAASAAFSVLARSAQVAGDPPPTLITGPEQDLVLAELLAGHARAEGVQVGWPATIPDETLTLRGFRQELRDLLMRAAERGLGPQDLSELGAEHARPEWTAAARLYDEYLSVMALRQLTPDAGARFDPAVVVDEAARVLERWDDENKPSWRLVVVDDYQEATAATARLLHLLAADGARLVLLADPDTSVQAFRGASPSLVGRAAAGRRPAPGTVPGASGSVGELGAEVFVLSTVWRNGPAVRAVTRAVTQEIGSVGAVEHRRAGADGDTADVVETAVLASAALEEAHVARVLRAEHLLSGTPWSRMAVVARSGSALLRLRRALASSGVPVAIVGADVPLRDEPAVRPLLAAVRAVLAEEIDIDAAVELLTSPLGGIDAVALRRLRRHLRSEELDSGGGRSSDTLLVEMLGDPARVASLPSDVGRAPRRVARLLAAGRAAVQESGATAQTVLWALWDAADVAETWRSSAVNGGPGAARADRDLDAVMALFRAAEQFVDRVPHATPLAFVDHLEAQDLPADSLAARAATTQTVQLLTPAGAAGGGWDVVVVAGVQDGTWPDLRLRDSLLGSQALVEVLTGRSDGTTDPGTAAREARRAVLSDELRAFAVAVSRARRRLVVTATSDADTAPSVFLDLVAPGPGAGEMDGSTTDGEPPAPAGPPANQTGGVVDAGAAPLDLRGVVATLRTELAAEVVAAEVVSAEVLAAQVPRPHTGPQGSPDTSARAAALAALLARLARAGISEADPQTWYGSGEVSSTDPLRGPDELVGVSPSKVEQVHRCSLRWALESAGATAADAVSQSVGTLIHDIARELPSAGHAELAARLDARWSELGLVEGWPSLQQRRRADAMVRRLADYYTTVPGDVLVEETFEVTVGRAVLRGSVDRLETTEGGVRVTDLKTGRSPASKNETRTNAQLGAYQLAVNEGAFAALPSAVRSSGAQLVFVGGGTRAAVREQRPLDEDPDDWARALVEDAAETMAGARFAAVENSLCAMCGVRRACPLQPEGRSLVHLGVPEIPPVDQRPPGPPTSPATPTDRTQDEEPRA